VSLSACSGLTHESVNVNSAGDYSRPWFAWANSLFGHLILKIADERPYLIFS
jgi:meiotically up-regulated gene 157 (Mug157) protein